MTTKAIPRICNGCGTEYGPPVNKDTEPDLHEVARVWNSILLCPSCQHEREVERIQRHAYTQRRKTEERQREWSRICPPEFREFDPSRLPDPDIIDEVTAWQYGPRGLLLYGPTYTGKTRCAWVICRREFLDGRSIMVMDSIQIGIKLPAKLGKSMELAEEEIDRMCWADILFFDDPFKAKLTDRIEEILFSVIQHRQNYRRPSIITVNDTPESLEARLSQDRGAPMIRRLRESCRAIKFGS